MQSHAGFTVRTVQLDNNLVCQAADGWGDTAGGSQVDFSVRSHLASFDDGNVHFAHESVAHLLRHL